MTDKQRAHTLHRPVLSSRPDEDWSGLASSAERRKLQNRINARIYRKRRSLATVSGLAQVVHTEHTATDHATATRESRSALEDNGRRLSSIFQQVVNHQLLSLSNPAGFPHSELLLSVTSLNVFRAFQANVKTLGWEVTDLSSEQALSLFSADFEASALPASLNPTQLQRSIPHHPVYDVFPDPQFRDQILLMPELMEDEDLCLQLAGFSPSLSDEPQGLIVWGEPYLINSWEVSESFFRRWQSLLASCEELVNSSNRWRALRGEMPLEFIVSH